MSGRRSGGPCHRDGAYADLVIDQDFLRAFEAGRLSAFSHRDHLRMAFACARAGGSGHAVAKAPEGIARLAAGSSKYHETLTVAWRGSFVEPDRHPLP
jgi:hypothetical protein